MRKPFMAKKPKPTSGGGNQPTQQPQPQPQPQPSVDRRLISTDQRGKKPDFTRKIVQPSEEK
jgi:hypothetical protein